MIHIIRTPATAEQIAEMLPVFEFFIKLAVDIEREILAGGGARHADCEEVLLEDGSEKKMSGAQISIRIAQKSSLRL